MKKRASSLEVEIDFKKRDTAPEDRWSDWRKEDVGIKHWRKEEEPDGWRKEEEGRKSDNSRRHPLISQDDYPAKTLYFG